MSQWTFCEPACIQARFPLYIAAEWELMARAVKRGTFGVMTGMGGSVQVDYQLNERAFKFWARDIARIPRKRWASLASAIEVLHRQREDMIAKEGKFFFTQADFDSLKEVGVPIEQYLDLGLDGEAED